MRYTNVILDTITIIAIKLAILILVDTLYIWHNDNKSKINKAFAYIMEISNNNSIEVNKTN